MSIGVATPRSGPRRGVAFTRGGRQRRGAFRVGGTNCFFRESLSAFWCEGIKKSEVASTSFRPQPHLQRRALSVIFVPPAPPPPGPSRRCGGVLLLPHSLRPSLMMTAGSRVTDTASRPRPRSDAAAQCGYSLRHPQVATRPSCHPRREGQRRRFLDGGQPDARIALLVLKNELTSPGIPGAASRPRTWRRDGTTSAPAVPGAARSGDLISIPPDEATRSPPRRRAESASASAGQEPPQGEDQPAAGYPPDAERDADCRSGQKFQITPRVPEYEVAGVSDSFVLEPPMGGNSVQLSTGVLSALARSSLSMNSA